MSYDRMKQLSQSFTVDSNLDFAHDRSWVMSEGESKVLRVQYNVSMCV